MTMVVNKPIKIRGANYRVKGYLRKSSHSIAANIVKVNK